MTTESKLLGTNPVSGEVLPKAVSFDGTSDYLTRSSNMTGNANSKTFTFSVWIYPTKTTMLVFLGGASRFYFRHDGANFRFFAYQPTPSSSTAFSFSIPGIPINTFSNVLCSIDLANTSNRYVYVNDIAQTVTWSVYNNSLADFSQSVYYIIKDGGAYNGGRLSNFFLDYTYRDLSVTANRRLFIDAEGKPSSTIPSNPIMYLPMTDAATAGYNSGTGGNFSAVGVLATAQRGPNQDNCSASVFDGSNDYLSRTSLTSIADGKVFTFSAVIGCDASSMNYATIMSIGDSGTDWFYIRYSATGISFKCSDASDTSVAQFDLNNILKSGQSHTIQINFDAASQSGSDLYLDGVAQSVTWSTFVNTNVNFTDDRYRVGASAPATYAPTFYEGPLGEVYFNTAYTDLATDNPFWDSTANLPNSVRKVIEDTGVTPLIALPIIGSDAGNNLGSGGDFTVNSGPYTGARGGSEYWSRSVERLSSSGYLKRTSIVAPNSKQMSAVFTAKIGASSLGYIIEARNGSSARLDIVIKAGGGISFNAASTTGAEIVAYNGGFTLAYDTWYNVFITFDTSDANKRFVFVDNVDRSSSGSGFYGYSANGQYDLGDSDDIDVLGRIANRDATLSNFYLTQDYIDFSQETNRNAFVDQLGYPVNLTPAIESGDLPEPLIYMKFEDTTAFGINGGTGGNFTLNGTLIAAEDVTPT